MVWYSVDGILANCPIIKPSSIIIQCQGEHFDLRFLGHRYALELFLRRPPQRRCRAETPGLVQAPCAFHRGNGKLIEAPNPSKKRINTYQIAPKSHWTETIIGKMNKRIGATKILFKRNKHRNWQTHWEDHIVSQEDILKINHACKSGVVFQFSVLLFAVAGVRTLVFLEKRRRGFKNPTWWRYHQHVINFWI